MVMKAMREGASGGIAKFFLLGFMALAVGGLVMMDIGGFFRGGVSRTDVAKAGREKIGIASFDRTVRRTLSRMGMSPAQAYNAGYINQILGSEIQGRLLEQAAQKQGVMISKDLVAGQIRDMVAPMVGPGQDPAEVLQRVLMSQGMSETDFVRTISRDAAANLMATTVEQGFSGASGISDEMARALYAYQNEERTLQYIHFPNDAVKDIPEPSEEALRTLYQTTRDVMYSTPETRIFKIMRIKTDSLKKTLEVSDEELRQIYERDLDLYRTPEQRVVEQAVLSNKEEAQKVLDKYKNGRNLKKAVGAVTGSGAAYLGEHTIEGGEFIEELKDDVMAAEKSGTVIGPTKSALGWHVAVVTKITPEHIKGFDEVKKELKDEVLDNRVLDEQYNLAGTVDDLLASGATPEEVAETVDLDIRTLPAVNRYGQSESDKNALSAYGEDRDTFLEAGFALEEGETSPVMETHDGKFVAVYLSKLQPKTYKPFEEVQDQIMKIWMNDQRRVENNTRTAGYLGEMQKTGMTLQEFAGEKDFSVQTKKSIERGSEPGAPLDPRNMPTIFNAPVGKPFMLSVKDGTIIAVVTDFSWPDKNKISETQLENTKKQIAEGLKNEALLLYLQNKQDTYGVKVNQSLLDQVYGASAQGN